MKISSVMTKKGRLSFRKGHKVFVIRKLFDFFRETGAWWEENTEYDTFRVELDNGLICDLQYNRTSGEWQIIKIFD